MKNKLINLYYLQTLCILPLVHLFVGHSPVLTDESYSVRPNRDLHEKELLQPFRLYFLLQYRFNNIEIVEKDWIFENVRNTRVFILHGFLIFKILLNILIFLCMRCYGNIYLHSRILFYVKTKSPVFSWVIYFLVRLFLCWLIFMSTFQDKFVSSQTIVKIRFVSIKRHWNLKKMNKEEWFFERNK